jgi:AMP-polyphosphate phosphotransferase
MLDLIDLNRRIDKEHYRQRLGELQEQLYRMEQALLETRIPVVIVFEGWAGTSKIGAIGVLMRRLDPRGMRVHSITPPRTFEMQYPWLHRFWLKIPSYGQVVIFDRSWYRELLAARTHDELDAATWRERCDDIASFERQLAADSAVIVKFWLHIAKEEQRRRFKKLVSDPVTAWQVTDEDRWQQRHYGRMRAAVEDLVTRTDAPYAPWVILPATDRRYAEITMLETVVGALGQKLGINPALPVAACGDADDGQETPPAAPETTAPGAALVADAVSETVGAGAVAHGLSPSHASELVPYASQRILSRIDLSQTIDDSTYESQLALLQAKLHLLGFQVYVQKRPVILIFEGWDAAGKGGAIHRITAEIDPRSYVVHPIAVPAGEDKTHHYLYRFWRRLPARGQIAIFDRSWYGRVLVERVEGFARLDEWQRAYAEIDEFERQLVAFGTIICKFWVHISPEEQLRRFEERQKIAFKSWKLTAEDWRNREKWPLYEQAADEMLLRTSTPAAPWTIVESEDKRFGRIKVLRTVVRRLEDELGKVTLRR